MSEAGVPRGLFGGAIAATLPTRFVDVAEVRQVPDNQEVFFCGATDQSVVIELLEAAAEADGAGAAVFQFGSIAHDNDATATEMDRPAPAAADLQPLRGYPGTLSRCSGLQSVAKFKETSDAANQVRVHVACYRLDAVGTDLVVSLNVPVAISAKSSSAETPTAIQDPAAAAAVFDAIVGSVLVKDFSLFGG